MKKLLCIVCLLATVLLADTASACIGGSRCGVNYGRASYGRSYYSRSYRGSYGYRGIRGFGRGYGSRLGRSYGFRRHYNNGRYYILAGGRSVRGFRY